MITENEINNNKERFFEILLPVVEERGVDVQEVINYFESSDFFVAPASTKYHNNFRGGLCSHCLNVYDNLKMLVDMKGLTDTIPASSVVVSSLLHDMAKINFYELGFTNVKVYCDDGDKWDNLGKFKWETIRAYKYKDAKDRLIYGNHEETSEYLARDIVPLTREESVAILKHHGGLGFDSTKDGVSEEFGAYPLACLLHLADMLTTYFDEERE